MESQMPEGNRDKNKAIAEKFLKNLSSEGNAGGADDYIHPDYVNRVAPFPDDEGPEGYRKFAARTLERYPDAKYIVEDVIATDEDKVVIRATFSGKYQARDEMDEMFNDQPMTMPTIFILQIAGDKVTKSWASFDLLGPMQRWGVIPDFLGISKDDKKIRVFVGGKELETPEPVSVKWGKSELKWPLIPPEERVTALLWPIRW